MLYTTLLAHINNSVLKDYLVVFCCLHFMMVFLHLMGHKSTLNDRQRFFTTTQPFPRFENCFIHIVCIAVFLHCKICSLLAKRGMKNLSEPVGFFIAQFFHYNLKVAKNTATYKIFLKLNR